MSEKELDKLHKELKAVEMYEMGDNVYTIFTRLDIGSSQLYKALRKYGVKLRRGGKK